MEKEKNNKGLIALVIVLVVLVLGLGGYIVYDKVLSRGGKQTDSVDNNEIDSAILNNLYDILGMNWDSKYNGDCLSAFLSNENYKSVNTEKNDYSSRAQRIFSLYAIHKNMYTDRRGSYICKDECELSYSCAECTSILKTEANEIKKIYGLNDLKFEELPGVDTDYAYATGISVGVCHYGVTHDVSSKYIDKNSIRIVDNQVVTDYEWPEPEAGEKINSTKKQTVTYDFKKGQDGNYYLSSVTVK